MIMIELETLNWSFQLLFYIYDMLSGMSRADVKNVLLIMHTDSANGDLQSKRTKKQLNIFSHKNKGTHMDAFMPTTWLLANNC